MRDDGLSSTVEIEGDYVPSCQFRRTIEEIDLAELVDETSAPVVSTGR
jgi:hypothetical protein